MIIGGNKEINNYIDLYSAIRKDWDEHQPLKKKTASEDSRSESFIFMYLKRVNDERVGRLSENPEAAAEGKYGRTNQYQLIEALVRAYENGKIDPEKALFLLSSFFDRDKRSAGRFRKKAEKITGSTGAKEAADLIFIEDAIGLSAYKDALILRTINDFFKRIGNDDLSYGDDIRLLSEYMAFAGGTARNSLNLNGKRLTDKRYLKYCEKLYSDVMHSKEAKDSYIPLGFDEMTGAGIIIVGKNKISKRALRNFEKRTGKTLNVFFAVIYFESWYDEQTDEFDSDDEVFNDIDSPDYDEYRIFGDIMISHGMALYNNLDEALMKLKERHGFFIGKYETESGSGIWNPHDESYIMPLSPEEEAEIEEYARKEKEELSAKNRYNNLH